MNQKPKVSIILLNHNNLRDTKECLESLKDIDYPNFEVILVDNNSQEEFFDEIKNNFSNVRIFRLKENRGFAAGNNFGIKVALEGKADYVLLLNNDTLVAPDFLSRLVETFERPPSRMRDLQGREYSHIQSKQIGVIGPKIYFASNPQKIWFIGGQIKRAFSRGIHIRYDSYDKGNTSQLPFIVDYISGCCMLVSSRVIKEVGLMREDFFLYYEDVDWCFRMRQKSFLVVSEPRSVIWHKVSRTTKEGSPFFTYYLVRNGFLFAKEWAGGINKFAAYLLSVAIFLYQIPKLLHSRKRKVALSVIRAILDFWKDRRGRRNITLSGIKIE